MDLSKLTLSDKLTAGGGLVLFIASFLPWFGVDGFGSSANGNGWDVGFLWGGIPALLGLAATGVILAKASGTSLPDLPISWGQALLGAGALSAFLVVLKFILGYEVLGFDLDRKWGLFVAVIASLVFAFGGFRKFQEDGGTASSGGGTGSAPF